MARLTINTGTAGNPATGDSLRGAFTKVNTNFEEVYSLIGDGSTGLITTSVTNGDLKIQPNGTGVVEVDQLQINGDDITSIVTNGSVNITGNGTGTVSIQGLSFPTTDGTNGQVLTTNGSGVLSFTSVSSSATLTFVGDDSSGTTVNSGETFKIAGAGTITTAVSGDTLTITGSSGAEYVEQSCRSGQVGDVVVATAISGSPDQIYMAVSTSSDASSSRECILRLPAGTVNGQTLVVRHQATSDGSANHTLKILNNDASDNVQNFAPWSAGNDFKAITLVWNGTRWYTIGIL
jgi:hypothetical protein